METFAASKREFSKFEAVPLKAKRFVASSVSVHGCSEGKATVEVTMHNFKNLSINKLFLAFS